MNSGHDAAHLVHMAVMGMLTSVVAPALVAGTRRAVPWHRVPAPPGLTLPLFVLLHGTVTVLGAHTGGDPALETVLPLLLLAGAIVFWLPVLAPRRPVSDPARSVYLFLAAPSLDLAAIYLVITGDAPGGLTMIVAMLPLGIAAVTVTWRWIAREERLVSRPTAPAARR